MFSAIFTPSPLGGSQLPSDLALVCLELKAIGGMVIAHAIPLGGSRSLADPAQVCLEIMAIGGTR